MTIKQPQGWSVDDMRRVAQARLERLPHGDLGNGYYRNPVLVGGGGDNTVVRVGADYYMLAGGGWPGLLVWHSRDLVNWRPITRALHPTSASAYKGGTWAPDITYHQGRYYIYTTYCDLSKGHVGPLNFAQRSLLGVPHKDQGDAAWDNIVLWADDPAGPWSDPIHLGVYGVFDPGHIVDREGNRYLYFNKGMMIRLTPDGLGVKGDLSIAYEGWDYPEDWVVECHCLEAPKLIYRDGYYYMSSAQGGTAGPSTAHMGVIARSRSAVGPWENSPYNPIVHTYKRVQTWWRQGHGTLIDDVAGDWWFLYTGYENGYPHYGKQCLLLPIEWTADGWPVVHPGISEVDVLPMPAGENVGHGMPLSDDFSGEAMGIQWMYDPGVDPSQAFHVGDGELRMQAQGEIPGERAILPEGAMRLAVAPVNHAYEVTVEVEVSDGAEGGLMLAGRGAGGRWATAGLRKGQALATWNGQANYLDWEGNTLYVRVRNDCFDVSCLYSTDGTKWTPFPNSTQVDAARHVSLYAAGQGEVVFRDLKYRGLD